MAANRIKGITVEIGGDTTKLQTSLQPLEIIEFILTRNFTIRIFIVSAFREHIIHHTDGKQVKI